VSLDRYWPSLASIDACIRTEAETVDPAVLLAVHEGGPLRVRAASGASEETKSERDLLAELLRPADEGSAVVVAITGDSGVGKSHMVRWLHAQLQRHPRRDQLVIVLVPKTASLRQVVERILEPLDSGRYEQLRGELSKAIESLTPDHASEMLAAALGNELDRKYKEGMEALRSSGNAGDRPVREQIDAAKGLRDVLRDPGVRDSWFGKVLKRIIRQTVEGGSEAETGELRRFVPEDLATPDDWDPASGTETARRYLQQLQSNDGARRPTAAAVLQDVLDPALRGVFRFSEALGQKTIEEIVGDIRKELLSEGKELVLLIEDFAALAGIQQPLLNLMIAESDHQGRRIRAPLRTALAVTDGFLPSRQTILTRAKREWIIPNTAATQEEIVLRYVDLAGRYLNAARWGVDALREQYRVGTDDWVRQYDEPLSADQADILSAFGKSRHGDPLFPLSKESIESLSRRELRRGTELFFNPRLFINAVLRDTLLLRQRYEQKAFPPPGFKDAVLPATVEMGLRAQALNQSVKDRLAPVLVHWAGNPHDLGAPARVSKCVFQAFDLPWPYQTERVAPQLPRPPARQPGALPREPTSSILTEKPGTPGLAEQIEAWASGERLPQAQARHIRTILASALKDRLDWNGLHMRASTVDTAHIWLPFAAVGNPSTDPKYVAGEEVRPLPANLRAGVLAVDRWYANHRSWDYPEAEDDYAIAQQLVDRLEQQAVDWLTKGAERQAAVAVRVLHRQALMLRLTKAADPRLPPLAEYGSQLTSVPVAPETGDQSPAAAVMAACARAASALQDVSRALYESVGCFQGIGSQLHAIDAYRLRLAWRSKELQDDPQQIRTDMKAVRDAAVELSGARINALIARYRSVIEGMVARIVEIIGTDTDSSLAEPLQALIASAHRMGLIPADNFPFQRAKRELELLVEEQATSYLKRAISFSAPAEDATVHKRLASWAEWDVAALRKTVDALTYLDSLVQAIEREAKAALKASGGGDVAAAVKMLQSDLDDLAKEGTA
jgi:hypothetical protein